MCFIEKQISACAKLDFFQFSLIMSSIPRSPSNLVREINNLPTGMVKTEKKPEPNLESPPCLLGDKAIVKPKMKKRTKKSHLSRCCMSQWPEQDKRKRSNRRSHMALSSSSNSSNSTPSDSAPPPVSQSLEEFVIPGAIPDLDELLRDDKLLIDFWSGVPEIDDGL